MRVIESPPSQVNPRSGDVSETAGDRLTRRRLWHVAAWSCLAAAPLPLAIGSRYLWVQAWPTDGLAQGFLLLAWFAHFTLAAMLPWVVVALVALIWPRPALVRGVGVLLASLLVVLLHIDVEVYRLYRFHLNGMVWSLIVNGGLFEILPLSATTLAVTAGVLVALLAVEAGMARWVWSRPRLPSTRVGLVVLAGLVLVLGTVHVVHAWADGVERTSVTKLVRLFPGFRPLTARKFMERHGWAQKREDTVHGIRADATLEYPKAPLEFAPTTNVPPNLLFLVIDGWRFDMLNEAVTPAIWEFSRRGTRFDQHYAAANATRYGIFALFYGLPGSYWPAALGEQRGCLLIRELAARRYQLTTHPSARLTSPEFDRTVFAEVRDRIELSTPGETAPERDRELTRRFLRFLDQRDGRQPFFGFLFYDSSHAYEYPAGSPAPFQPEVHKVEHLSLNAHTDPVPIRNRFLNATHFCDAQIGEVLRRLEAQGLLERTIVVITGDHGQEFNETGRNTWGHNSDFSRYQTQVPFVLHWPGRPPGVVSHVTSHLDLVPTVLSEAFGCRTPMDRYSAGRSLFDPTPRWPLILASWDHFALLSPGRIDVFHNAGLADAFDTDYREINTRLPSSLGAAAMEVMARFYRR